MPPTESVVNVSDATLVRGVLAGDRSAFAELYDRYARVMRALAWDITRDTAAACDLTQESYLRAYRDLGRLRDPERFAAWLAGILRQVGREWQRGKFRRRLSLEQLPEQDCPAETLSGGEQAEDELHRLREAIATLPEHERLALHAFYLQDLDAERARTVVGVSRSGLYKLLSRARALLRSRLNSMEVQP